MDLRGSRVYYYPEATRDNPVQEVDVHQIIEAFVIGMSRYGVLIKLYITGEELLVDWCQIEPNEWIDTELPLLLSACEYIQ